MPGRPARSAAPAPTSAQAEEVDQINTGNGEGSSNETINNRASQAPVNSRDDVDNDLVTDDDLEINAQIESARAAESSLAAEVERLEQHRRTVDAINRRILELEQHKRVLRD